MKTANRVLAILMAVLMACSTFAVAASAAGSLQTAIDNAPAGGTVSISQNTKESVTVDKNLTIDLGGKILKSANGSPAITVKKGATVTIQNGYVESYYYSYSGANSQSLEVLGKVTTDSPAAIQASGEGTTVILNDVRAMGGLLRIPKTTEWFVPTGSAVKIYGGANVVLNGAVLIGSYGVSNDPANTGSAQGTVTINEAIIIGYVDYVKRVYNGVVYDEETVEKVNAKDRITGFLNSGITLTSGEQEILNMAMDDRIYIFTQKPVDDQAIVTLNKNTGKATITASEVEYMEREIGVPKSTDCSYKYVPFSAYDVETGKTYALDTELPVEELEGKEIRINYRLYFELKGDVKKVANDFDAYYTRYYNAAIRKADAFYAQALDMYNTTVIGKAKELYQMLDEAGQETVTIEGQPYNISNQLGDKYYAILRSLLTIGGVTMYNAANGVDVNNHDDYIANGFSTNQFNGPLYNNGAVDPGEYVPGEHVSQTGMVPGHYEGEEWIPAQMIDKSYDMVKELGTLDKLNTLVEQFKALKGAASLGDQSKWASYVHFILDNYKGVLDLVTELKTKVDALKTTLTTGETGEAITKLGLNDKLGILDTLSDGLRDVKAAIDVALDHPMVKSFLNDKIDAHANDGTVEEYTNKLIGMINNYRTYFTPEKFVTEDGKFGKTYTVTGPTEVVVIEKGKLNVSVVGSGVVNFTPDNAPADKAETYEWTTVPYGKKVTLSAVADAGNEFLYFADAYTQRILSTNPTFVVETQVERYVEAVFESVNTSKVIFTNTSGVICDDLPYSASIDASGVEAPVTKGYKILGWGPNGNNTLTSDDFTSIYRSGNSAFEDGATYPIRGFAFKLNSNTNNKYLVTPKLKAEETFDVTFKDGNNEWSKTVTIGNSVSYTAQGDGFKYWKNDKGQIVSVYRAYTVQVFQATTLEAVYEGEVSEFGYVNIIASIEEDARFRIYAERSIPASYKVLSVGTIASFSDNFQNPEVTDIDNVNVKAAYSTKKTNQGIFSIGMTTTSLAANNGKGYARAFVEIQTATGSKYIYSDAVPVNG